jgi:ferredoxin
VLYQQVGEDGVGDVVEAPLPQCLFCRVCGRLCPSPSARTLSEVNAMFCEGTGAVEHLDDVVRGKFRSAKSAVCSRCRAPVLEGSCTVCGSKCEASEPTAGEGLVHALSQVLQGEAADPVEAAADVEDAILAARTGSVPVAEASAPRAVTTLRCAACVSHRQTGLLRRPHAMLLRRTDKDLVQLPSRAWFAKWWAASDALPACNLLHLHVGGGSTPWERRRGCDLSAAVKEHWRAVLACRGGTTSRWEEWLDSRSSEGEEIDALEAFQWGSVSSAAGDAMRAAVVEVVRGAALPLAGDDEPLRFHTIETKVECTALWLVVDSCVEGAEWRVEGAAEVARFGRIALVSIPAPMCVAVNLERVGDAWQSRAEGRVTARLIGALPWGWADPGAREVLEQGWAAWWDADGSAVLRVNLCAAIARIG